MNVSIDELLMKLDHEQFHGPSSGPETDYAWTDPCPGLQPAWIP